MKFNADLQSYSIKVSGDNYLKFIKLNKFFLEAADKINQISNYKETPEFRPRIKTKNKKLKNTCFMYINQDPEDDKCKQCGKSKSCKLCTDKNIYIIPADHHNIKYAKYVDGNDYIFELLISFKIFKPHQSFVSICVDYNINKAELFNYEFIN